MPTPDIEQLRQEVATVKKDILTPYYGGDRVEPRDETLINRGGGGVARTYDVYADILKDCHAYAVLQKRFLEIISREWVVEPASESKPDGKAADMVREMLTGLSAQSLQNENSQETEIKLSGGFDQTCLDLLPAILNGFSTSEIIWDQEGKEIRPVEILQKDIRRFAFNVSENNGYNLRLLTWDDIYNGEPIPARKMLVHRFSSGGMSSDPYGLGLGTRLFYPTYFKRNAVKFWLVFSDRHASPTAVIKHPRNANQGEKDTYKKALRSLAQDAGVMLPENVTIEFLEAQRSSTINCYKDLVSFCDSEISKCVLGETGSTDQSSGGGSRARDEVGNSVRIAIAKADADMLSDTLNRTLLTWITRLNFGDTAQPPKVWRRFPELEEKENLNGRIGRDKQLFDLGFRISKEKVAEVYGDGYETTEGEDQKPPLVTTLGVSGTASFIQFLAQVAEGALPRENAIAALSIVFGMSKEEAAQIVPEAAAADAPSDPNAGPDIAALVGEPAPTDGTATVDEVPTDEAIAPDAVPDVALSELDYKDVIPKKAVKSKPNCTTGYSCGSTCIAKSRKCKSELAAKSVQYASYLEQQIKKLEAQLALASAPKQPKAGDVVDLDPSAIAVDPKRFQYKLIGEHTASGTVGSLSGVKKWDANLAGVVQVWRDPADGKTYVVNGHNRLELAKKLGADKVTVRFLDVKDATEARATGALTNIAEGRGNALDAAKFFKDTGLTKDDLDRKGIPMREKIATDGIALSKLDDSLFRKTIDGDITIERASIIGGSDLAHDQQRSLVKMIDSRKSITNETVNELIDTVKASQQQSSTQFDLFGANTTTVNNAIERAQLQASIKKRLAREKKLFGTVSNSVAAAQLQTAGNVINVGQSKAISQQASASLGVFDQFKNQKGAISDLLNTTATAIQNGGDRKKLEQKLYRDIFQAISSSDFEEETLMLTFDQKERVLNEVGWIMAATANPELETKAEPPVELAENPSDRDSADVFVDKARKPIQSALNDWNAQIAAIVEGADSYEEMRSRLDSLYPKLKPGDFVETFASAIAASELAGRWEVLQEGEVDLSENEEFTAAIAILELAERADSLEALLGEDAVSFGENWLGILNAVQEVF